MERLPSLWVDKAMIRLLLSDIDGTLIQYDPKIHKTDVDAIHQLQEHGVQFGLVTGRDIGFCRHLLTCLLYTSSKADGVHMDEENHRKLAYALAKEIRNMQKDHEKV